MDDARLPEDRLSGEDGRIGVLLMIDSTRIRRRLDDVRPQLELEARRISHPAGEIGVFRERVPRRRLELRDGLRSPERSDIDLRDRDKDEVLVQAVETADDGEKGVNAESIISVDQLNGRRRLPVRRLGVDRTLGRDRQQQIIQFPDAAPDLIVMPLVR